MSQYVYGSTMERYRNQILNKATDDQIRRELKELSDQDAREGRISEIREGTKRALKDLLHRSVRTGW